MWWFEDYEFLGLEIVEKYVLPDNTKHDLVRHKRAHVDCIRKYGMRIDK